MRYASRACRRTRSGNSAYARRNRAVVRERTDPIARLQRVRIERLGLAPPVLGQRLIGEAGERLGRCGQPCVDRLLGGEILEEGAPEGVLLLGGEPSGGRKGLLEQLSHTVRSES